MRQHRWIFSTAGSNGHSVTALEKLVSGDRLVDLLLEGIVKTFFTQSVGCFRSLEMLERWISNFRYTEMTYLKGSFVTTASFA